MRQYLILLLLSSLAFSCKKNLSNATQEHIHLVVKDSIDDRELSRDSSKKHSTDYFGGETFTIVEDVNEGFVPFEVEYDATVVRVDGAIISVSNYVVIVRTPTSSYVTANGQNRTRVTSAIGVFGAWVPSGGQALITWKYFLNCVYTYQNPYSPLITRQYPREYTNAFY